MSRGMRWVFTLLFTFAKVGLVFAQNFSVVLNEGDSIGSNIAEIYLQDNTLYYPSISIDGNSRVYEYNLTSGEASKNLSTEIKQSNPDVPWAEMYLMRNKISHEYFGIDYEVIWDVATNYLPDNQIQIEEISENYSD